MKIGIPKECKNHEYRVAATPWTVRLLVAQGHQVFVQSGAGDMVGFSDEMYKKAGAEIVVGNEGVYECELVVKVKEPQRAEYPLLRKGQILFCFLHLAADIPLTQHLIESGVHAIAFETVTDDAGRLPLLTPMSEVAGRVAIQVGATSLQLAMGGRGVLFGGVPGVAPAKVKVIGGGVVGTQAARMALGLGADVTIFDRRIERLRELDDLWGPRLKTLYSTPGAIEESLKEADLVVGAVLLPGKKAPKVITEKMIQMMQPGSVFVDVAIDQGGCSETSRPTSFSDPTYVVHNVLHYCVTNMPAAYARTSTEALSNAITPWVLELANKGFEKAMKENKHFLEGLNVCNGAVCNKPVSDDCGFVYTPKEMLLG